MKEDFKEDFQGCRANSLSVCNTKVRKTDKGVAQLLQYPKEPIKSHGEADRPQGCVYHLVDKFCLSLWIKNILFPSNFTDPTLLPRVL